MKGKRILIIDDDKELCEELADALNAQECAAVCISDPYKGEDLIRNGGFDLVFLDYKMPGLTGLDILKRLKADGIKKRIFIFSGRPIVKNMLVEAGLSDMVEGIINKPFDLGDLFKK